MTEQTSTNLDATIDEDDLGNAVDDYMYENDLRFNSSYYYLNDDNLGIDDIADALWDMADTWTMREAIEELC